MNQVAGNKKVKNGYTGWVLVLFVIFIAVALLPGPDDTVFVKEKPPATLKSLLPATEKSEAVLYFADKNYTGLKRFDVEIESDVSYENRLKIILAKLFVEAEFPIFPEETSLREVFIFDRTAVISLDGGFKRKFNGGVWTEILAVASLVNTVVESFDMIDNVRILIDDNETEFFVAHTRIAGNLTADHSMIVEEPAKEVEVEEEVETTGDEDMGKETKMSETSQI